MLEGNGIFPEELNEKEVYLLKDPHIDSLPVKVFTHNENTQTENLQNRCSKDIAI